MNTVQQSPSISSSVETYPSIVQFQLLNGLLQNQAFAAEVSLVAQRAYAGNNASGHGINLSTASMTDSQKDQDIAINVAPFYALDALVTKRWLEERKTPVETLQEVVNGVASPVGVTEVGLLANATWKAGQPFRGINRIERSVFQSLVTLPQGELNKDHVIVKAVASHLLERMRQECDRLYPLETQTVLLGKIDDCVSHFQRNAESQGIYYDEKQLRALRKTAIDCMFCHAEQTRNYGAPYFLHLLDVANIMISVFKNTDIRLMHIAFKHDIREDQRNDYELRKLYRLNKIARNAKVADNDMSIEERAALAEKSREFTLERLAIRMLSKLEPTSKQMQQEGQSGKGVKEVTYHQLANPRAYYKDADKPYDDAWIIGVQIVKLSDILANMAELSQVLIPTSTFEPSSKNQEFPVKFLGKILDYAIPNFVNDSRYLDYSTLRKFYQHAQETLCAYTQGLVQKNDAEKAFANEISRAGGLLDQLKQAATLAYSSPRVLEVPLGLRNHMPELRLQLAELNGDLNTREFQQELRDFLMADSKWSEWIQEARGDIRSKPLLVKAGLGIEQDDECARKILVGLALCLEPNSFVPPYKIDKLAVTEILAKPNTSTASHSQNDLPAPPHTAGFFEEVPPHTCYFSCIRPHPGGGAETTVLNLQAVLDQASQELIDDWSNNHYLLKNSRRYGEQVSSFTALKWIDGVPFLRYRKEYTVDFEKHRSLVLLEEMVANPANQYVVRLEQGETLIHWNGAPHSRLAQIGATPDNIEERRKLIRCRTEPVQGWREKFE